MFSKINNRKKINSADLRSHSVGSTQNESKTFTRKYQTKLTLTSRNSFLPVVNHYKPLQRTSEPSRPNVEKKISYSLSSRLPIRDPIRTHFPDYLENKTSSQAKYAKRCLQSADEKTKVESKSTTNRNLPSKYLQPTQESFKLSYSSISRPSRITNPDPRRFASRAYRSPSISGPEPFGGLRPFSSHGYDTASNYGSSVGYESLNSKPKTQYGIRKNDPPSKSYTRPSRLPKRSEQFGKHTSYSPNSCISSKTSSPKRSESLATKLLPSPTKDTSDNRYVKLRKQNQNGSPDRESTKDIESVRQRADWKKISTKYIPEPSPSRYVPRYQMSSRSKESDNSVIPSLLQKYRRICQHLNESLKKTFEAKTDDGCLDYVPEKQTRTPNEPKLPTNYLNGNFSSDLQQTYNELAPKTDGSQFQPLSNMFPDGLLDLIIPHSCESYNIENENISFTTDIDLTFESIDDNQNGNHQKTDEYTKLKSHQPKCKCEHEPLLNASPNDTRNGEFISTHPNSDLPKSKNVMSSTCDERVHIPILPNVPAFSRILTPDSQPSQRNTPPEYSRFSYKTPDSTLDNDLSQSPPLEYFYVDDLQNYCKIIGLKSIKKDSPRPNAYFGPMNRIQRASALSPVIDIVRTPEKLHPFEGLLPNVPSSGVNETENIHPDDLIRFEWSAKRTIQPMDFETTPANTGFRASKCKNVARRIDFDNEINMPHERQTNTARNVCKERFDIESYFSRRNPDLVHNQTSTVYTIAEDPEDATQTEIVMVCNETPPKEMDSPNLINLICDSTGSPSKYIYDQGFIDTYNLRRNSSDTNSKVRKTCPRERSTPFGQQTPESNLAEETFPDIFHSFTEDKECICTKNTSDATLSDGRLVCNPPITNNIANLPNVSDEKCCIYDESPIVFEQEDNFFQNKSVLSEDAQTSTTNLKNDQPMRYVENSSQTPSKIIICAYENVRQTNSHSCSSELNLNALRDKYNQTPQGDINTDHLQMAPKPKNYDYCRKLKDKKVTRKHNYDNCMDNSRSSTPRTHMVCVNRNYKENIIPRTLLFDSKTEQETSILSDKNKCTADLMDGNVVERISPAEEVFEFHEVFSILSLDDNNQEFYEIPVINKPLKCIQPISQNLIDFPPEGTPRENMNINHCLPFQNRMDAPVECIELVQTNEETIPAIPISSIYTKNNYLSSSESHLSRESFPYQNEHINSTSDSSNKQKQVKSPASQKNCQKIIDNCLKILGEIYGDALDFPTSSSCNACQNQKSNASTRTTEMNFTSSSTVTPPKFVLMNEEFKNGFSRNSEHPQPLIPRPNSFSNVISDNKRRQPIFPNLPSFTPCVCEENSPPNYSPFPNLSSNEVLSESPPMEFVYIDDLDNYWQIVGMQRIRPNSPRPNSYYGPKNKVFKAPVLSPVIDIVRTPPRLHPFEGVLPNLPSSRVCEAPNVTLDNQMRFEWSPRRITKQIYPESTPRASVIMSNCSDFNNNNIPRKINFNCIESLEAVQNTEQRPGDFVVYNATVSNNRSDICDEKFNCVYPVIESSDLLKSYKMDEESPSYNSESNGDPEYLNYAMNRNSYGKLNNNTNFDNQNMMNEMPNSFNDRFRQFVCSEPEFNERRSANWSNCSSHVRNVADESYPPEFQNIGTGDSRSLC